MKPKWLKYLLAFLGGLALVLFGVATFLDERRELALEEYRRKKLRLLRRKRELEEQDKLDQERLAEIQREMEEARRQFLLKCAGSKYEVEQVKSMTAEEVADETSRLEALLRRRVDAARGR